MNSNLLHNQKICSDDLPYLVSLRLQDIHLIIRLNGSLLCFLSVEGLVEEYLTKFASKLPKKTLSTAFAFLLIIVAVYIISKSVLLIV